MTIAKAMLEKGISGGPVIVVVDGKVTEAARQCMEVIADYDMILATGHIAPNEMIPVVRAAKEAVVITHPEFPATFLTIDEQKELAKYDVMFERCFTQPFTGKVEWSTVYENIRTIGPSSTILSTDLGQSTAPWVEEGMGMFFENLLDNGFTESELEVMSHTNAGQILGELTPAKA